MIKETLINIAEAITEKVPLPADPNSVTLPGGTREGTDPVSIIYNLYDTALLVGGLLAFGAIVYGGIKYTLAAGNPSGQTEGKEWIKQALYGLLLLFGVYTILNVINPELTNIKLPKLAKLPEIEEGTATGGQVAYACFIDEVQQPSCYSELILCQGACKSQEKSGKIEGEQEYKLGQCKQVSSCQATAPQCRDGKDNDGDGGIDHRSITPEDNNFDPDCESQTDNSESKAGGGSCDLTNGIVLWENGDAAIEGDTVVLNIQAGYDCANQPGTGRLMEEDTYDPSGEDYYDDTGPPFEFTFDSKGNARLKITLSNLKWAGDTVEGNEWEIYAVIDAKGQANSLKSGVLKVKKSSDSNSCTLEDSVVLWKRKQDNNWKENNVVIEGEKVEILVKAGSACAKKSGQMKIKESDTFPDPDDEKRGVLPITFNSEGTTQLEFDTTDIGSWADSYEIDGEWEVYVFITVEGQEFQSNTLTVKAKQK